MTILEKILANHSKFKSVKPGDIVDIKIDARVARDFGGANVVKHIEDNGLEIEDVNRTFFTFDTNPTGSDQKYAANQQVIRQFARKHGIHIYDINTATREWTSPETDGPFNGVAFGDLDGDNIPDRVYISFQSESGYGDGIVTAVNGATEAVLWKKVQTHLGVMHGLGYMM